MARDTEPVEADPSDSRALASFLDRELGGPVPAAVTPMQGGGSCEVFAIDRGDERWVLRRAPAHASSATAHDVLREHRILAAIDGAGVRIPRPIVACGDPDVFGSPFYVMERIDGVPVRSGIPEAWVESPETQGRAVEELIDAIAEVHAVDWQAVGLGDIGHPDGFLERQVERWLAQLASYEGRELPSVDRIARWLDANRPAPQAAALFHGDYKLDNVLYATDAPPRLLAVVDWEMASIGDPLVDLAWALIFHPTPGSTMPLGMTGPHVFAVEHVPPVEAMVERYAARTGRDVSAIDWYHVFSRWKLAIVLEGSYAKWLRGASSKSAHEYFGPAADRLLDSATELVETAGG
jgi:aminoglycoside phosphotransferase (APT) family kinase protein